VQRADLQLDTLNGNNGDGGDGSDGGDGGLLTAAIDSTAGMRLPTSVLPATGEAASSGTPAPPAPELAFITCSEGGVSA
jgi:hypothetical protein